MKCQNKSVGEEINFIPSRVADDAVTQRINVGRRSKPVFKRHVVLSIKESSGMGTIARISKMEGRILRLRHFSRPEQVHQACLSW